MSLVDGGVLDEPAADPPGLRPHELRVVSGLVLHREVGQTPDGVEVHDLIVPAGGHRADGSGNLGNLGPVVGAVLTNA